MSSLTLWRQLYRKMRGAFSISDSLVPVLEFAGEDADTLNGKSCAKQMLKDQNHQKELTEEQVKANGGKEASSTLKLRSSWRK